MPIMKLNWKPKVQKVVACLAIMTIACGLLASGSPRTANASDTGGIPAASLVLKTGYAGGSYTTVKTFTNAELCAMANIQQTYSFIDSMPAPIQDPALGVKLTDLLTDADIGGSSVQGFTFYSTDGYITHFTEQALLETPRYYYPNIVTDWDSATGAADLPGAAGGAVQVPTILAVEDNWERFENPPDFNAMTGDMAFRLMFGQTDTQTPDASRSAKWVREIDVTLPPDRIRERVDQVIARLGIEAFREADPNRLSGGEKHLVALASVLALDPPVLVLDEVMSGLDAGGRMMVAEVLKTLRCQGKTVIAVEHDFESVAFADRILVLDGGAIARWDRTELILADRDWLAARRLIY